MSHIFEEPPDENEQYENLDEALDEADLPGHDGGPEGARDLDVDVVADQTELEEVGAQLDAPAGMSMVDGGMDDPDGTEPPRDSDDSEAGWDVDPVVIDRNFSEPPDAKNDGDTPQQ